MHISYLLPAVFGLALGCILLFRSRSAKTRLSCELGLLLLIGGCLVGDGAGPLPTRLQLAHDADAPWIRALAVLWWLIGARIAATLTVAGLGHDARSRQARLFSDLLAGAIYLTATLVALDLVLDLPIAGLVATSGVVAIVLGLALQNTLADVISGIAVGIEHPFHVGDRITIADHVEGVIVQMNWRSVRIQTDGEDIAIIPNSIVARSQIINRSVPTERRADRVEIPVRSKMRVELIMDHARQAVLLCPTIMSEPPPAITVKALASRKITLVVKFFVAESAAVPTARSELLCRMARSFHCAGVFSGEALTPGQLLGNLASFETLTGEQLDALGRNVRVRRLDRGDVLIAQGSVGASLYAIGSGALEIVYRDADGREAARGRIGPGDQVGEISMMSGDPRPASVRALTPATVYELQRSAIEALMRDDRALATALEQSVRNALAKLDRYAASETIQPLAIHDSLLQRIRDLLHPRDRPPSELDGDEAPSPTR